MKQILAIVFMLATTTQVHAGVQGHGGDEGEVRFHVIGETIADYLKTPNGKNEFPEVDESVFRQTIEEVKVSFVEEDLKDLHGNIRTAVNLPDEKRIYVDRRKWAPIESQANVIVPLVFHEYLGIIGIERDVYTVSQRIQKNSVGLLTSAIGSIGNIYFYTAQYLHTPIALYKSSLKYDQNGNLKEAKIARTQKVVTSMVQLNVFDGEALSIWKEKIVFGDVLKVDRKVKIRQNEKSPWTSVNFNLMEGAAQVIFYLDFLLNRATNFAPIGLAATWNVPVLGSILSGFPKHLSLRRPAEGDRIEIDWSHSVNFKNLQFESEVWSTEVNLTGTGDVHLRSKDTKEVNLKPIGSQRLLKFRVSELLFSKTGELLSGILAPQTQVRVNGVDFETPDYERAYFQPNGTVRLYVNDKRIPFGMKYGAPVLWSRKAEEKICKDNNIDFTVSREPEEFQIVKVIDFTGERTFYDIFKDDFVTLKDTSAKYFEYVECVPYANPYPTIALDLIVQP